MYRDRELDIKLQIVVDKTERNRICCAVFVVDDGLCVEEIDPLILTCVATLGETLSKNLKGLKERLPKLSCEDGRLS